MDASHTPDIDAASPPPGMLVLGLGSDIVELERIRRAVEKHGDHFLRRVFTEEELAYCLKGEATKFQHLAARFAAKEAISKAFGTGICELFAWKSASVRNVGRGRPLVILDDKGQTLLARRGGTDVMLTLSHTEHYAEAVALLVRSAG
jgi:holo-[acyl-carrier protein] synthase